MTVDKFNLACAIIIVAGACANPQPTRTAPTAPIIHPVYKPNTPAPPPDEFYVPQTPSLWIVPLPPEQFDKPYTGYLTIVRATEAKVAAECGRTLERGKTFYGCSHPSADHQFCTVYILNDEELGKKRGSMAVPYEIVLRHELGHCWGWRHE